MPYYRSNGGVAALAEALKQMGKPYVYGGDLPPLGDSDGTDCSGLVQWAYYEIGVTLPRTTYEQYLVEQVTGQFEPGDCLFFTGSDPGPNGEPGHVGLYRGVGVIGAQQHSFIHPDSVHGQVVVFNAPYTDDPYGIRYDYAENIGPVVAHTRPALLLPPAPPPQPESENDMVYTLSPDYLCHGDKKALLNADRLAAVKAQGIPNKQLTAEDLDQLVEVNWGEL